MLNVRPQDVARRSEVVRFRRAIVLLGMTLIVPGSAQLMCGNKAVGRAALRVVGILAVGALGLYFVKGRDGLIELGLSPWALVSLQSGLVVLGLCWLALFMDAWRLGRPPELVRTHRLTVSVLSLVLMAGVATPAAYGANLLQEHRNFLERTFQQGGVKDLYNGRLNILLLGGDGGNNRAGIRADSITLASMDVATGKTVLFSLPRNLQYAQFPPGSPMDAQFPNGFPDFAFGIYTYGSEHPELFKGAKDPGAVAMMQAVAQTLGIPVHYHALVNLAGFKNVVDALGGVTIRVEKRLPIGGGKSLSGLSLPVLGYIEPGLQELDGYRALWYGRSRATTTDYDRMSRQKCLMGAILRVANPANVLRNYKKLTKATNQVLSTDLSLEEVQRLIKVLPKAKDQKLMSVQFSPPAIDSANPDITYIRAQVQLALTKANASIAATPKPTAKPPAAVTTKTTKKKKKKAPKPTKVAVVPGESMNLDDTCRYS